MSGYDCRNKCVLSFFRNTGSDGADVMSGGYTPGRLSSISCFIFSMNSSSRMSRTSRSHASRSRLSLCASNSRLQAINQSINQSINKSINQPINQSITQSTNQQINQSTNQSMSQNIFVQCHMSGKSKASKVSRTIRQKEKSFVSHWDYTVGGTDYVSKIDLWDHMDHKPSLLVLIASLHKWMARLS